MGICPALHTYILEVEMKIILTFYVHLFNCEISYTHHCTIIMGLQYHDIMCEKKINDGFVAIH